MSYDYEKEVKDYIRTNYSKVVLPILLPIFLLTNFLDWMWYSELAPGFLILRVGVSIGIFSLGIFVKRSSLAWGHKAGVWATALLFSTAAALMASQIEDERGLFYLHSINIVAGLMVFLFPLSSWHNLITLACAYMPGVFLLVANPHGIFSSANLIFYVAMMAIFGAGAATLDAFRKKMYQQKMSLYMMATTDSLSGLKVRRYFYSRFIQELVLRMRKDSNMVISLIMMDIDSFKNLNDQYGHEAGDQCIRVLGDIIRKNTRIYDVACRFGGEEFAILLPETPIEEAKVVAERIRKSVQETDIPFQNDTIYMTASLGVSGMSSPISIPLRQSQAGVQQKLFLVSHMMTMIREADAALYEAKAQRKNRVVVGREVPLSDQLEASDIETAQAHLANFEQVTLSLQSADSEEGPDNNFEDFNFYTEEYFFRRCVEGLYRYYRNPEWKEVLAVMRLEHPNPEIFKKHFHKMFRLSDTVTVFGKGCYGILFGNMTAETLDCVRARIQKQLSNFAKNETVTIRVVASPLAIENSDKNAAAKKDYYTFSKVALDSLNQLKNHRFTKDQLIYIYQPGSSGGSQ